MLERENAAILNASLIALAEETIRGFEQAKKRIGLSAPLFVTQSEAAPAATADGSLPTSTNPVCLPVRRSNCPT